MVSREPQTINMRFLQKKEHTIEGLDPREVLLPAAMLAVDFTEVGDKEGIFLTGLAKVGVDSADTVTEGSSN